MGTLFRIEFWLPVAWSLVLLISWVGWGAAVQGIFQIDRNGRTGWGLRAGWGICMTLLLGGLLILFGASYTNTVASVTLAGVGVFFYDLYSQLKNRRWRARISRNLSPGKLLCYVPAFLLAAFWLLGAVESSKINWYDDASSYMVFTHRMLESGTLMEPLSWRRLSTYGGQQFLQAQMLVVGSDFHINLIDMGVMPIILAAQIYGMIRPRKLWQHAIAGGALFMVLLFPVPRINAQAQCSGAVGFVALLQTLLMERRNGKNWWGIPCVLGMTVAGISTLRMNFLPGAVMAMGFAYLGKMVVDRGYWKKYLLRGLIAMGAFVVCLAPWAIVLYQSSRSLFYPLMRGYHRPDYEILEAGMPAGQKVIWSAEFLMYPMTLVLLIPLLLAIRKRFIGTLIPFYCAVLLTSIMTAWVFTRSEFYHIYRYSYGMLFAAGAGMVAWQLARSKVRWRSIFAGGMLLVFPCANVPEFVQIADMNAQWIYQAATDPGAMASQKLVDEYREAQSKVPHGEAFLAVSSFPIFFDYARNTIYNIDFPGAASPDPGMPVMKGTQAVKEYLLSKGIRYVIIVDFDKDRALFSRKFWKRVKRFPDLALPTDRLSEPFTSKFMDEMEEFEQTEELRFKGNTLRVVRLTK